MFTKFHSLILDEILTAMDSYGIFEKTISKTSISENDFCTILTEIFSKSNLSSIPQYKLGNGKYIIDIVLNDDSKFHYIEVKDCNLFEKKYEKSLAYCKIIEDRKKSEITQNDFENTVPGGYTRWGSKTDWFNYWKDRWGDKKVTKSEGLSKDVYKLLLAYQENYIKDNDPCTCISFVFWPKPFPLRNNKFSKIQKGDLTIKVGTEFMINQIRTHTNFKGITYNLQTFDLPTVELKNPDTNETEIFRKSELKVTIELLSWIF